MRGRSHSFSGAVHSRNGRGGRSSGLTTRPRSTTAEPFRPSPAAGSCRRKGAIVPSMCVFPSTFASFRVTTLPPPQAKRTNPWVISNFPRSGTAPPRQLAALPREKRRLCRIFGCLEEAGSLFPSGFAVLERRFAVFERGISSICDARLSIGWGIAASCRGFAAFGGTFCSAPCGDDDPRLSRAKAGSASAL